jgi:hypothetical protein
MKLKIINQKLDNDNKVHVTIKLSAADYNSLTNHKSELEVFIKDLK